MKNTLEIIYNNLNYDIRHLKRSIPVTSLFICRLYVRFVVDSDEYMVDNMSVFYAKQQAP